MVWFLRGLTYPFRGLSFSLEHRHLLRFFPGPMLLGVALVVSEILGLRWAIHTWFADASRWMVALAWLGGLFTAALIFLALQGVLASPFCDVLSARTEAQVAGAPAPVANCSASALSIAHAAVRAVVYLAAV